MIYNEYVKGDMVRLFINLSISGSQVDPTHLALDVTPPSGAEQHFVYGATGSFIKDGVGEYHLDYFAQHSGQYRYAVFASGTAWGAEVRRFVVTRE